MKILYNDSVEGELVEQATYYADIDTDLALRFLDACNSSFRFLLENPYVGSLRNFEINKLTGVRMWRVKGFEKHLIFYYPDDRGVTILHVVHSAVDYNRVFEND
jgi:toxin ParE1/3/4